jgi:LUD domain
MTEVQPDLDRTLSLRFAAPADDTRVTRTAAALEANGITVLRAPTSAEAKRIVLDLIPAGSQVHQGASQSLEASGIADEIERSGRYDPLRPLGVGIVGVSPARGWAATAHIPALRALPNYEIGALTVHSAESARTAGEVFGSARSTQTTSRW